MKVLLDTNVIMDVLMKREPHFDRSAAVLRKCGNGVTGCIAASQSTDIFYLLRRGRSSVAEATAVIKKLATNLKLIDVTSKIVVAALDSPIVDFEDALLVECAKLAKVDYIVTRNTKDFIASTIPIIDPTDFMDKFFRMRSVTEVIINFEYVF